MRLLRCLLFSSAILVVSCNSNKDKGGITIKDKDGNKTTINLKAVEEMAKAAEKTQDKAEELKKLTPLSLDQLKAMMPEEFMGMKRSSFSANSMMGAAFCEARYKGDGEKELKLSIYDCAGEAGAGIYSLRYWTLMNFQQEDDNGYQKSVDFSGQKAVEKYTKYNDEYGLTYMANDRFLVSVEGQKIGLDAVKQAANSLNLKAN
ncbi:MAG: hypothetical protein EPN92_07385 [Chitinophagaceae bacterium]|nr:MAG: hypothetical protein EPN92_07385 [Chitinophagaceae bacterium]